MQLPLDTVQPKPQLPQTWDEALQVALSRADQAYQTISKDRGAKLNLRKLVANNAEAIIATNQKGIPYRLIAEEMARQDIYISETLLRQYISQYRKQKGQIPSAKGAEKTLQERLKAVRL